MIAINQNPYATDCLPNTLLVDFIRDQCGLTGTHVGCDTAQCGACTVLVDGAAVKSCNVLLSQVSHQAITTIEGLQNADGTLHTMQQAFATDRKSVV